MVRHIEDADLLGEVVRMVRDGYDLHYVDIEGDNATFYLTNAAYQDSIVTIQIVTE